MSWRATMPSQPPMSEATGAGMHRGGRAGMDLYRADTDQAEQGDGSPRYRRICQEHSSRSSTTSRSFGLAARRANSCRWRRPLHIRRSNARSKVDRRPRICACKIPWDWIFFPPSAEIALSDEDVACPEVIQTAIDREGQRPRTTVTIKPPDEAAAPGAGVAASPEARRCTMLWPSFDSDHGDDQEVGA